MTPNKWLQLTVQLVTPLAGARGAPSCPAAEPGCSADKRMATWDGVQL